MVFAFPVVHAAAGDALEIFVYPDFLAGGGVEGDEGAAAAEDVDVVAGDDGVEAGGAGGVGPGDVELVDVGFVDLGERGEVGVVGAASIVEPELFLLRGEGGGEAEEGERGDDRNRQLHGWLLLI